MASDDKRKHIRTKLSARVRISHTTGSVDIHTSDISDGGAYILSEGNKLPDIGELVDVQIQGMGEGEGPVVKMRIVRIDSQGVGLSFID